MSTVFTKKLQQPASNKNYRNFFDRRPTKLKKKIIIIYAKIK